MEIKPNLIYPFVFLVRKKTRKFEELILSGNDFKMFELDELSNAEECGRVIKVYK